MVSFGDVKQGDTVTVGTRTGVGPVVTGVVTAVYRNAKNGCSVIDYSIDGNNFYWAYLDQIKEVIQNH